MDKNKMMNNKLNLDQVEIVIDVGLNYTKCGFSKDSVPMHVVPTTIPLVQLIRDNLTEVSPKEDFFIFVFSTMWTHLRWHLKTANSFTWKSKNS